MEVLGDFNTNNITFEKINYDKNETRLLGKINILGKFARIITAIILAVLITLLCNKYNNKAVERFEYRPWMPFYNRICNISDFTYGSNIIMYNYSRNSNFNNKFLLFMDY
mgnify:CR=1 FL=1